MSESASCNSDGMDIDEQAARFYSACYSATTRVDAAAERLRTATADLVEVAQGSRSGERLVVRPGAYAVHAKNRLG